MKNMKKVLAVMTAVSAMAASTSAFAADNTATVSTFKGLTTEADIAGLTATYDLATNDFDVVLGESFAPTGDMTLLILDKDMTAEEEANVQDGDIRYIDQGTAFTNAGLKLDDGATELAPGTYKVKVGYDDGTGFAIAVATITVEEGGEVSTTIEIPTQWGDVDGNGIAEVLDSQAILTANVSDNDTFTTTLDNVTYTFTWKSSDVIGSNGKTYTMDYQWGEVDGNGVAEVLDSQAILTANVSDNDVFGDYAWKQSLTLLLTEKVDN